MLSPLASANRTYAFSARLIRDLVDAGVVHLAVCAGSRSAPLAATAATTGDLDLSSHVDERSAGFFALGLARASRAPVALVCTSGTAASNFAPAVAEADRAGVPLIVLTADRPAELRDRGAPQTIDQVRLYGTHVRWFHEPPPPDEIARPERLARALAERAVAEATGPRPGPVHLNLPFREPLDPSGSALAAVELAPLSTRGAIRHPDDAGLAALEQALCGSERPVLVAGPWDPTAEGASKLADWARQRGVPVLAEPLSGLRAGTPAEIAPLISTADALLRSEAFAATMAPDLVIRIGAPCTSKAVGRWQDAHPAKLIAFDPEGTRRDPTLRVDHWIDADPQLLGDAPVDAAEARDAGWLPAWLDADKRARDAIRSARAPASRAGSRAGPRGTTEVLFPPDVLDAVAEALPDHAIVYLANSLALRDAETFLPPLARPVRFLGNRGANGIDGTLSSALGAAATGTPVVLLAGDLALLHDAGAWWTARRMGLPLTVIGLNDGGGGIFDHLPIASRGAAVRFDEVFRIAHEQALVPIAEAYGCRGVLATEREDIVRVVREAARPELPTLVEVRFDPAANLELHREVWRAVEHALAPVVRR